MGHRGPPRRDPSATRSVAWLGMSGLPMPLLLPLEPADLELVEAARAVIDAATDAGPGEDGVHTMGAAVRADDGRVFVGVNLYHFTGGPCAELVALATARAGGARRITRIVAVGNHGRGPIGPCGRDRQVLFDHHRDVRVILPTPQGPRTVAISDLMPLATAWSFEHGSEMA